CGLGDAVSMKSENLDAVVGVAGEVSAPTRVARSPVGRTEYARRLARLAPCCDEFPVLGKLHDTVIGGPAMAIRHVNVAVGRDDDAARTIQVARGIAGHAGFTEGHQDLALGAELDDHGALSV